MRRNKNNFLSRLLGFCDDEVSAAAFPSIVAGHDYVTYSQHFAVSDDWGGSRRVSVVIGAVDFCGNVELFGNLLDLCIKTGSTAVYPEETVVQIGDVVKENSVGFAISVAGKHDRFHDYILRDSEVLSIGNF